MWPSLCLFVDFLWLNDREVLSCSKDGRVLVQTLNSADKPTDKIVRAIKILSFLYICKIEPLQCVWPPRSLLILPSLQLRWLLGGRTVSALAAEYNSIKDLVHRHPGNVVAIVTNTAQPRWLTMYCLSRYPMSFKREPDSSQPLLDASNCLLEYQTSSKARSVSGLQLTLLNMLLCRNLWSPCNDNGNWLQYHLILLQCDWLLCLSKCCRIVRSQTFPNEPITNCCVQCVMFDAATVKIARSCVCVCVHVCVYYCKE